MRWGAGVVCVCVFLCCDRVAIAARLALVPCNCASLYMPIIGSTQLAGSTMLNWTWLEDEPSCVTASVGLGAV